MRNIFIGVAFLVSSLGSYAQSCPEDFTDTGAHCLKPPSYGRGFGHRSRSSCEEEEGASNCEKCLSLYYPRCKANYKTVGCNICEPICPPNMTDIGISCQK